MSSLDPNEPGEDVQVKSVQDLLRPMPWALGQSVIVISGPVGANKAILARELEKSLGGSTSVAFSDHLKDVCAKLALPMNYKNLQDLGMGVIEQQGYLGYCVATLRYAKMNSPTIILDGLRHVLAANAVRRVSRPNEVFLVHVEVSESEQREHLIAKGELESNLRAILEHPVENESHIVRHLADRIIRSDEDARRFAADVQELLQRNREQDRDEMFKSGIVSSNIIEELWQQPDRFEALREIARFLRSAFGDTNPVKRWLKLRVDYAGEQQSPLQTLREGEPTAAIRRAIGLVMSLEANTLDSNYMRMLKQPPLSEFFEPLSEIAFVERSDKDFGRPVDL